jgi:CheY-like chemotaxis protein
MDLLIAHGSPAARTAIATAIGCRGSDGRHDDAEVRESGDGQEVLDLLLEDGAPRVAVVDWDLPGIDGPELCRLVRDYRVGGPPYIVVLASGRHADASEALEAGANDCIRTPAPATEIRDRVEAGMSFVSVPWESRDRAALLDAVRSEDSVGSGSASFNGSDDDRPESIRAAVAGLEAVLHQA